MTAAEQKRIERERIRRERVTQLTKQALGDKTITWILLILIGPLVIVAVGAWADIHPFESGDLYIYDIVLLFAGFSESLTSENSPHRWRQIITCMSALLLACVGIFWTLSQMHGGGNVFTRWDATTLATVLTGIVATGAMIVGAAGAARAEVARWLGPS